MKQVLNNLSTGEVYLETVPRPTPSGQEVLIRTTRSLISAGTERMLVDFGKAGWIQKARQQPDKVRMVLDKVRTDGLMPTVESVRSKLDQPLPLGYCNVGVVVGIGEEVEGFKLGDRVVSNGNHAEYVCVPQNLCARIPERVSDEEAAFTVIGAIALQGIRLINPTLGETVVVTGLGLIGLMAVRLLRANGCRVIGLDYNGDRCREAESAGATAINLSEVSSPLPRVHELTGGAGVDAVLLTAATSSNEPVSQGAAMCRKRGRIVLVGVTGLELSRADFYEKELSFQVSCSYGPGRYDPEYEQKGHDYPLAFVRWTQQRNFEAILETAADGNLHATSLISHRFELAEIEQAYDLVTSGEPSLGILLTYPEASSLSVSEEETIVSTGDISVGAGKQVSFIGAGNYATRTLAPAFSKAGAQLHTIVSQHGISGTHLARKSGFAQSSTDATTCIKDGTSDAIVIATRHDSHADLVIKALEAGKHVFVEKPLALTDGELDRIVAARESSGTNGSHPCVMVGFNRRFAPSVVIMRKMLAPITDPKSIIMTVNAGHIPSDHWTQDPLVGGGRIIGEACHFIDLARFFAQSPCKTISSVFGRCHDDLARPDVGSISIEFENGSHAVIHYLANGSKAFPKERIEVFTGGRILQLDNYRTLKGFGWKGFSKKRFFGQDKGQVDCAAAFLDTISGKADGGIPFTELVEVTRATLRAAEPGMSSLG